MNSMFLSLDNSTMIKSLTAVLASLDKPRSPSATFFGTSAADTTTAVTSQRYASDMSECRNRFPRRSIITQNRADFDDVNSAFENKSDGVCRIFPLRGPIRQQLIQRMCTVNPVRLAPRLCLGRLGFCLGSPRLCLACASAARCPHNML